MKTALILAVSSFISLSAFAGMDMGTGAGSSPQAGDKSAIVCADAAQTVCAQLQFISNINSSEEASFLAALNLPAGAALSNFKLDLWMKMGSHGHGSAPVELADAGLNTVKVTNAWFVMAGPWTIRIDFDLNGTHQHIEIPVYVAQ